jgi:hypothetical protein
MNDPSMRKTTHNKRLTKDEIIEIFRECRLKQLEKDDVRADIIDWIIDDYPSFRTVLSPLIQLCVKKGHKAEEKLEDLERDLIDRAVWEAARGNLDHFQTAFYELSWLSSPSEGWQWPRFLEHLTKNNAALSFIRANWPVRKELLDKARQALLPDEAENDEIILPLLTVKAEEFGNLLIPFANEIQEERRPGDPPALFLPPRWNYLAIKRFVKRALAQFDTEPLAQYRLHIQALVKQVLADVHETDRWQTLQDFFMKLAENRYEDKQGLLFVLLDAHPADKVADNLLHYARLTTEQEAFDFFQHYQGNNFLSCYCVPRARDLYIRLGGSYPQFKPYLFRCLRENMQPDKLARLITASRLDEREKAEVFESGGKGYYERDPQNPVLRDLARCYLLQSVAEPPLTRKHILDFADRISTLSRPDLLIDAQAEALERGIDGASRLGFIISTLSLSLTATEMDALLYRMAARAHNAMMKHFGRVAGSAEASDGQADSRRFSAYLQFALCADTIHDAPPSGLADQQFGARFLDILLSGDETAIGDEGVIDGRLLAFINNNMVPFWPADLRQRWQEQEKRLGLARRENIVLPPALPASAAQTESQLPAPSSTEPAAITIAEPDAGLEKKAKAEKDAVLQKLNRLMSSQKRRIKKLAIFWLENRATLTLNQREITDYKWDILKLAYEFYAACQTADTSPGSLQAEKDILRIYGKLSAKEYVTFTYDERERIRMADRRVNPQARDTRRL